MLFAYLADTFLLFRSESQLLIAIPVIGRMPEDSFQIEVDGVRNACRHIVVKGFEAPCHPYLFVCAEMRALLSCSGITKGIDDG